MSDCPHCHIPMRIGRNIYEDKDGVQDYEDYYYCDECGADYS